MKKMLVLALALLMVLSFASCGGKTKDNDPSAAAPAEVTDGAQDAAEPDAPADDAVTQTEAQAAAALLPGELCQLDGEDAPVVRGLTLAGNRIGTTDFNSKPASDKGIRCIFALNEWVEITPDTDAKEGLGVWVFTHRDDPEEYKELEFSEEAQGSAAFCDLPFDPDAEPGAPRGSFYLNPDDCAPGYYDLIFTLNGKAVAVLLTRFYNEAELEGRSDAELEQIMTGLE